MPVENGMNPLVLTDLLPSDLFRVSRDQVTDIVISKENANVFFNIENVKSRRDTFFIFPSNTQEGITTYL